jgi:peptide-methionine (S)-S-oxide reductase
MFAVNLIKTLLISAFTYCLAATLVHAETASTPAVDTATFAGGCFWCMEPPYDKEPGVISTTSGYTGGQTQNPTYETVSSGTTGHYESIQIQFDPSKVSYARLLEIFWHNIDPFDENGQFCDKGSQYRSAIFYHNENQKQQADASKQAVMATFKGKTVVTDIVPATTFYPAEDYHQDYYHKNPNRYKFYRFSCGRDQRLQHLWQ